MWNFFGYLLHLSPLYWIIKRFDTGMWKFFGYLVLIDCFGSFPIFNDFFYGFAVSYNNNNIIITINKYSIIIYLFYRP